MAHATKYAKGAVGHLAAHYERRKVFNKDTKEWEYVKFGNQDIDPTKTHLNYNLAPDREMGQVAFIRQRLSEIPHKKRKDLIVMCDWVVTLPKECRRMDDLHVSIDKDRLSQLFFERTYEFLKNRYGEENTVSAFVHRDEKSDHMHFSFVPVCWDKEKHEYKVSAKTRLSRTDLQSFHKDLEKHLDSYGDWHFEVLNEATKDGNRTVAELKQQTAIEETQKAQEKAAAASQEAQELRSKVSALEVRKSGLEGEIEALENKKDTMTAAEVAQLKGIKGFMNRLDGVNYTEFQRLKATAAKVDSMERERDAAIQKAEKAENKAAAAEKEKNDVIENMQQYRPDYALQRENERLESALKYWKKKYDELDVKYQTLSQVMKEKAPQLYKAVMAVIEPVKQQIQKTKNHSNDAPTGR